MHQSAHRQEMNEHRQRYLVYTKPTLYRRKTTDHPVTSHSQRQLPIPPPRLCSHLL